MLLLLLVFTSINPNAPSPEMRTFERSDTVLFVWSNYERIVDVSVHQLSAWTGYWSQKQPDGEWSVTLREPMRDIVLDLLVEDPLGARRSRFVDKFGYLIRIHE